MSLAKLFYSGRFIRKELIHKALPKRFCSGRATREECPSGKEGGSSDEKPLDGGKVGNIFFSINKTSQHRCISKYSKTFNI